MLQNTIAAISIAAFVGFLGGFSSGHILTKRAYQIEMLQERDEATKALISAQDKVLDAERKNEHLTNELNSLASAYASRRDKDANTIRGLLASRSNWVRSPCNGESQTRASDSAPSSAEGSTPDRQLSGEFQEWLVETLKEAGRMKDYAQVCHGYILEIEAQRERLQNE